MTTMETGAPPGVVAVAASAGGVEALSAFVASLPADFPGTVLVVLHIPPGGPTVLPQILARAGKLPARHPLDGERLAGGVIFVAPPDRHLAVEDGRVRLLAGPRENGHRPSADALLRSVAEDFGTRGAGVVLSGTMDDGAAGLRAVRAVGGLALVQDPAEAAFPGMPLAAIDDADPQFVGTVEVLADHLGSWLAQLPREDREPAVSSTDPPEPGPGDEVTPLTCTECGGTLFLHDDYGAERYRCRVGHSFSAEGLLVGKEAALEKALWAAAVALEERADLMRRVSRRLGRGARPQRLRQYDAEIADAEERAQFLRNLVRDLIHAAGTSHDEGSHGASTA